MADRADVTADQSPDGHLRVLVVDRWRAFAEALSHALRDAGLVAAHAGFDDAERAAERLAPDVALIDARAGEEAVSTTADGVRAANPAAAVVLLRTDGQSPMPDADLAGEVPRDADLATLLAALERAADGGRLAGVGASTLRSWEGKPVAFRALSPREREVLALLAGGATNADAGAALGISPQTVRTHVANLLGKLGVNSRLEAAVLARREGVAPPTRTTRGGDVGAA